MQSVRIFEEILNGKNVINIFFFQKGRIFYLKDQIQGDFAARSIHFLETIFPVMEVEEMNLKDIDECFFVDGCSDYLKNFKDKIVSIRQIGKNKIGNVRLCSKQLVKFWQDKNC